jgi:thiosulfate/3-mercaptopyruvate sulfurtransferase
MTYANPTALVDTTWLAARLDDPSIAIMEVDEDTGAFEDGHIPGAVALDWRKDLQARPRRDFIDADVLVSLLSGKGISDEQRIILYGGNNNWFAAYAYWLFRYRGIDNISLLDGGRVKWEAEGREMTTQSRRQPKATRFEPGSGRPLLRAHRDDVIAGTIRRDVRLVDVRSPAEYSGETMAPPHLPTEQPYVAGHIPGAANVPWSQAANEDGTFRSADELLALYTGAGLTASDEVITYCRIGERSSHTWFVLSELLGFPRVANYDGSWTEYGSLVGVPVETGEAA